MSCPHCDAVITRNARLIVRLRHFAAAVHRLEHHAGHDWTVCNVASCHAAQVTIEKPEAGPLDHQARTPNGQHYAALFKDGLLT